MLVQSKKSKTFSLLKSRLYSNSKVEDILLKAVRDGFNNAEVFIEKTETAIWETRSLKGNPELQKSNDQGISVRVWSGRHCGFSAIPAISDEALEKCYERAKFKIASLRTINSNKKKRFELINEWKSAKMNEWSGLSDVGPQIVGYLSNQQLGNVENLWSQVWNRVQDIEIISTINPPVYEKRTRSHVFLELFDNHEHVVERALSWSCAPPHNLEKHIEEIKRECCRVFRDSKKRIKIPCGRSNIVFGEELGSTFFHEMIGHFAEAHPLNGTYKLWPCFSTNKVLIKDDPTIKGGIGSQVFDDEGTPTKPTVIYGKSNRLGDPKPLTDFTTHLRYNLPLTGSARRQSFRCPVMPRMSNLVIEGVNLSTSDLIKNVGNGVYVQKVGHSFIDPTTNDLIIEAREGYTFKSGDLFEPLQPFICRIPFHHALDITKAVAVDSDSSTIDGIWCEKFGSTIQVGIGRSSILIDPVEVISGSLTSNAIKL